MNQTIVFLGPSVRPDLRSRYARRFQIRPPVAAGDLLTLRLRAGDVVGIVDGYFRTRPAVRHKEILHLLESGVAVHGAASMGALRGAELAAFGMVGHGRIFEDYRSGVLVADDEVAVLHATSAEEYAPLTEALVNVRYKLEQAVTTAMISRTRADNIISSLKEVPFADRTLEAILAHVDKQCDDRDQRAHIRLLLTNQENQKTDDALTLLEAISRQPTHSRQAVTINRTRHLKIWLAETEGSDDEEAGPIADALVLDYCRVLASDYPAFHQRVGSEQLRRKPLACWDGQDLTGFERWLTNDERRLPKTEQASRVMVRAGFTEQALLFDNPFLDALRSTPAFERARSGVRDVLVFNKAVQRARPDVSLAYLAEQNITDWFMSRLGQGCGLSDIALQRGYSSAESFVAAARPFYLYDKVKRLSGQFTMLSAVDTSDDKARTR
nr:TfuA-like protein [Kibdelosporangium sp. MJ126-NF4]CEL18102.1 Conserved protein [Kibdelosporangium sp. MJ126-NF4]CTQ90669.1 Conserved protein [Kibdelosporangium sp. MJ126-NF4]